MVSPHFWIMENIAGQSLILMTTSFMLWSSRSHVGGTVKGYIVFHGQGHTAHDGHHCFRSGNIVKNRRCPD